MLQVDPARCVPEDLAEAVAWLRQGRVVAFPTDTLYGLAVDPASAEALDALVTLKGRSPDLAIPVIAASREQVDAWCGLSPLAARLADAFWPGPLSLICDAPASAATALHAGRGTVAIRVPDHGVARALALAWGGPVTATSANRSGEPAASRAATLAVWPDPNLFVIDGGDSPGGAPSTIVDARGDAPILVREGAIAWIRVLHSIQR